MNVILLFMLLGALYTSYSIYCLVVNFHNARQINVPLVIIPVSPENPVWMLLGNRIVSMIEYLFGETHFTRFSRRGWVYYDKHRAALELGDHFAFVTPDKIWVYICNADTLNEVLHRRNDFPRPIELLAMLNVFGPNVSTVEGVEWQRQRKITSGPFNEQNSDLVWNESILQAQEVLTYWASQKSPIRDTTKHVRTLSLHVLSCAGFGKSYSFQKSSEPPKPGHMFNYRDALAHVLDHIMLILVFGPNLLRNRLLPKRLSSIGQATVDFKAYMTDMYNEEKGTTSDSRKEVANIMVSLVRATRQSDGVSSSKFEEPKAMEPAAGILSESEVYGNIFVYNFAGHDTTAITLSWTIYLLAAHPEVQDWLGEEINEYYNDGNAPTGGYIETFPKLKRCFAVLLEVLRLYNPLPGIIKSTGDTSQDLRVTNNKTITVPAHARVVLHTDAIHTHPMYWGSDSLEWRPQRWIACSSEKTPRIEDESLIVPPQGTYAPWSGGPRVCPGKKFGQVEFVAIMATFFKEHRVEPVPRDHESIQCARARTLAAVKDSGMILLLQMLKPETIGVRWTKKGSKCD